MSLTIKNTTLNLWLARGEITHFATLLNQAGRREEAEALTRAGTEVGRALLSLEDLLDENDGAIKAAIAQVEEAAKEGTSCQRP
ncbi:hypothetical protein M8009_02390 [Halomonas sp. ATCH28]|uniref:Uncharacterized protein n=1 Tax=Halomonas gemina TaxID=2945105 RepID=A0ABT0SYG4_9GAMM|nr:hypothetical protein [Halomonas gemina]MCL7939155.1 hypothetical protein [Halomonas gemina]